MLDKAVSILTMMLLIISDRCSTGMLVDNGDYHVAGRTKTPSSTTAPDIKHQDPTTDKLISLQEYARSMLIDQRLHNPTNKTAEISRAFVLRTSIAAVRATNIGIQKFQIPMLFLSGGLIIYLTIALVYVLCTESRTSQTSKAYEDLTPFTLSKLV